MGVSFEEYIPIVVVILKAIAIGLIGLGAASILKTATIKILMKVKHLKDETEFIQSLSNLVYYFILLITVVAVLEILGLKYITQPFIDLLNKVMSFIPNIIGAVIILFIGILLSKFAKDFVKSLLVTLQVDDFAKKYKIDNLSGLVANFVYLVLVLMVIMASLNALNITIISQPATEMISSILLAIPKIVAASIVFGIIFFVGKLVAEIVAKIVDDINLDKIANEIGLSSDKIKFDSLVKYIIITFATLIGLSQAFDYIEATSLYALTQDFIQILFKVLVASMIIFAALYIGNQFENKLQNKDIGKIIKIGLILMVTLLVLSYIGISPEIITTLVLSLSFGVGLAFALAFGLGGKDVAKKFLEEHIFNQKSENKTEAEKENN
jgi:small-conductance mechanosensitive channel